MTEEPYFRSARSIFWRTSNPDWYQHCTEHGLTLWKSFFAG